VTASSAEEWRHHATEDGSHLNEKATKIRTASALKKQNSKGLSQKQQGPAYTEPLKRSPSESILELRSILPPEVSEHASPFDAILAGEYHEETKEAFKEKPWKRHQDHLRFITCWLFKTPLGHNLPLLVRQELAKVIRMARSYSPAGSLLSVEVDRHHHTKAEKPAMVSMIFEGSVKQISKATNDSRLIEVGGAFNELLALGDEFREDTVGVIGGPRGADLVQIPTEDYERLVKPYRRLALMNCIDALTRCALFSGIPNARLGRMALSLEPVTFKHKQVALKQGQACACLFVVSKGSFVCGRSVEKRQKNTWPVHKTLHASRSYTTRAQPCITTSREARGGFFAEEGIPSVYFVKRRGAQRHSSTAEVEKSRAFCSVVSEGASEVIPIREKDLQLLIPPDREFIVQHLKANVARRPPDSLLRKRSQIRKLMQSVKHSIIRRDPPRGAGGKRLILRG
jgi:hypothetical protein